MTRILLTGPFKPFAVDNIYSRKESIPELFHNQLTHFQGIFSPRKHYPTYGLHLIGANVPADVTVLDWPSLPRFAREVKTGYDYVGIGSIIPNFSKVKLMVETVRDLSPRTKIIIGGFCAMLPQLERELAVDYVCRGEGISFMRELLGLAPEFEFVHPDVGDRSVQVLGLPVREYLPSIVTSLGCNRGCDFCSPTHFFGKRHLTLIPTGQKIFAEMERLARRYHSNAFGLVGDDNFLANPRRAQELRACLMDSGRPYSFGTFGSADLCSRIDPRELAEMGIDSIWIGRESKFHAYAKNEGIDFPRLVDDLSRWGIRVIMSSILLLDCHTKDNVWEDINDHIACRPTFSQFAHLSPVPGTPLWDRLDAEGRILRQIPLEEWHAFKQPWFIHPEFSLVEAERLQRRAYEEDFLTLGPSMARLVHTTIRGYLSFKQTDSPPLLARARIIEKKLWFYRAVMADMEMLADSARPRDAIRNLREDVERMVGETTRFEKFIGAGAYSVGATRRLYNRIFSDVLQPKTRVTRYPADWKRKD
jgi:radical SAM superfamily enzyme YgiQ (UPF0313 family)